VVGGSHRPNLTHSCRSAATSCGAQVPEIAGGIAEGWGLRPGCCTRNAVPDRSARIPRPVHIVRWVAEGPADGENIPSAPSPRGGRGASAKASNGGADPGLLRLSH
jgi:hypothetical protein